MTTLALTLSLPPSKNHSHKQWVDRRTGRIRRLQTSATKEWTAEARILAAAACNATGWVCAEDDVVVELVVYFPDRRVRDAQNYEMVTFDALEGVIYRNDKQIAEHTTIRRYDKARPRVEVKVRRT
jgi:Holliday junction resolvase RusA-like endonuclease